MLFWKIAPESGAALRTFDDETLKNLNQYASETRLLYLSSELRKAGADLYNSANRRLDAELYILRLCNESLSGDFNALSARIEYLENALANLNNNNFNSSPNANFNFNYNYPNPSANFNLNSSQDFNNQDFNQNFNNQDDNDAPPWTDADAPPPDDYIPDAPPYLPDMPPDTPARPGNDNHYNQDTPERLNNNNNNNNQDISAPTRSDNNNNNNNNNGTENGFNWPALMTQCRSQIPVFMRSFLANCIGVMNPERVLTIYAPDQIVLGRVDNDRVRGVLLENSGAARIQFKEGDPPAISPEDNLNQLLSVAKNYDNIIIKGE